jgi:hypothetical protein
VIIATGETESHPGSGATPLPYDPGLSPGVAPPTMIVMGQLSGPTVPGRDTTGEYQSQMAAAEAECHAAQSAGMSAENDRRAGYDRSILPAGATYGDTMTIPPVPDNAVPPAMSDAYPYAGMEPTPAGAGFFHGGDEPLPQ